MKQLRFGRDQVSEGVIEGFEQVWECRTKHRKTRALTEEVDDAVVEETEN